MTFEEWFQREQSNYEGQWSFAKAAWEAADRAAREECAGICDRMTQNYSIADDCADAIRETLK